MNNNNNNDNLATLHEPRRGYLRSQALVQSPEALPALAAEPAARHRVLI